MGMLCSTNGENNKARRSPLERLRRQWEDNIKIGLRLVGLGRVDLFDLARDRDSLKAFVKTVINLREYGRGDPLCWPSNTLYPQKLALTLLTNGGRSVGIVRSRTKATELFVSCCSIKCWVILE
jgi:hypothetical protein